MADNMIDLGAMEVREDTVPEGRYPSTLTAVEGGWSNGGKPLLKCQFVIDTGKYKGESLKKDIFLANYDGERDFNDLVKLVQGAGIKSLSIKADASPSDVEEAFKPVLDAGPVRTDIDVYHAYKINGEYKNDRGYNWTTAEFEAASGDKRAYANVGRDFYPVSGEAEVAMASKTRAGGGGPGASANGSLGDDTASPSAPEDDLPF